MRSSTLWLRELCSDLSMTVHQKHIDRRRHTWYSIYCSKVRWARCCSENSALILAPHKFIPQNIVRSLTGISTCKNREDRAESHCLGFVVPFCRLTGKDRPFRAADDVLSAALATHFGGMGRGRPVLSALCCFERKILYDPREDLLTGSVPKTAVQFAFPLFLANLLQALYNVVDMLVGGQNRGKDWIGRHQQRPLHAVLYHQFPLHWPDWEGAFWAAPSKGANDQTGQAGQRSECLSFYRWWVPLLYPTILGLRHL